jgi:hypothetical protein
VIVNLPPVVYVCDKCPTRSRVGGADRRVPMHDCPGRALMSVPLVPEGQRGELRLIERDDYVGTEDVRTDAEGRVFMRAELETATGISAWVYAPTVHTNVGAG